MDGHAAFGITKALTPRARALRFANTDYDNPIDPATLPAGMRGSLKERGLHIKALRRRAMPKAREGNQMRLF